MQHISVVTGSQHSSPPSLLSSQPRDMISSLLSTGKGDDATGSCLQEHWHSNIWAPNRRCSWHRTMDTMELQPPLPLLLQSRTSTGRVLREIFPGASSHVSIQSCHRGGQATLAAVLSSVRSRVSRCGTTPAQKSCRTNLGGGGMEQETP